MGIGEATGASSSYRWIDCTTVQDRGENPDAPSHNTQKPNGKRKEKKKIPNVSCPASAQELINASYE